MKIGNKSNKEKNKHTFSTTQLILLGFLGAIIVGTLFLCLPFSTANGKPASFIEALFTATTSVCVTGLVVVETATYWSLFGKIVILILIQCGGLGIISFTTATMLLLHKKITLRNRLLLVEAFNLSNLSGLLRFLKKVFKGTFIIEGIGAFVSAFTFVPVYGPIKGVWISVFHSISAFCNAGIDIIGADSLIPFKTDVNLNLITMFLIIAGGLGFPVWFDLCNNIKTSFKKKKPFQNLSHALSLHSKMVILFTFFLIIFGTAGILILEWNNQLTLGEETIPQKILSACFQSVTLRTAGFCSIPQQNLTDAGALVSMLCMFVGGSPIGTAGGIKTTTAFVLIIAAFCLVRGKQQTTIFGRTLSLNCIRKALGVVIISIGAVVLALFILLITEQQNFLDLVYEVFSASATVGLSRNLTSNLSVIGKIVIIICMYLGRIGPITLAIALGKRSEIKENYRFPVEEIPIG